MSAFGDGACNKSRAVLAIALAGVAAITVVAMATPSAADTSSAARADKNCSDFPNQKKAQEFFIAHGGPTHDPHGLDRDRDGIACESNPCPCSTATGGGGGGGGGGGAPPPPKPTKTQKMCGKILGATGSKVCVKVVTQGGKLRKVKYFQFRGLPGKCPRGQDARLKGKGKKLKVKSSKRFIAYRTKVKRKRGVHGRVIGRMHGGKRFTGEIRVRFRNGLGARCDTELRRWSAR